MRDGIVVEFHALEPLVEALRALRSQGYRELDAFTPFPAKEAEEALGLTRSPLPRLVLAGGLLGAAVAYLILWWTQAVDYPINVAGHPDHAMPAFIPITFETAVLFGGVSTFVGLLYLCGLPRLWSPVFEVEGFERTSVDRFWLSVDARDPKFSADALTEHMTQLGALRVVHIAEGAPQTERSAPE